MKHLKYLWYLIRHKTFVFRAGLVTKAPLWNLFIHDWSKFMPCEWFPYAEQFYGNQPGQDAFAKAWLHHIHFNPHHWNHYVLVGNNKTTHTVIEIPEKYVREMIADWLGASRTISGSWDLTEWWTENKDLVVLHEKTRPLVDKLLKEANESNLS